MRSHAPQLLLVTLLGVCLGSDALSAFPSEDSLLEASQFLASIGVDGLCHPTSNEFAPAFPQCETLRQDYVARELLIEGKDDLFYIKNGIFAFVCVTVAALAAGLTMGLMSLDPLMLLIKMRAGATEREKKQAASLLPIVKQHHLLLVTLLLLNAMANEALPLFLDALVPSYVAVILSVTLVLFFGEIIPSAIFTGPNQINLASHLVPLVKFVMFILLPISWPIAKALDHFLHEDEDLGSSIYNRGELTALVRIQYEERLASKKRRREERASTAPEKNVPSHSLHQASLQTAKRQFPNAENALDLRRDASDATAVVEVAPILTANEPAKRNPSIHHDEVSMVVGALSMKTKFVIDVYTPLRRIYAIPYDTILDERNLVKIYSSGYSRIPVYKKIKGKTGICGVLMTKQLIVVEGSECRPISTLPLHVPPCVSPKTNLVDIINMFQTGTSGHLALVCARPDEASEALARGEAIPERAGLMGLITLEDALEQLLQEQILDESDKLERDEIRLADWAYKRWRLFVKKKQVRREEEALEAMEHPALLNVVQEATRVESTSGSTIPNIFSPLLGNKEGS